MDVEQLLTLFLASHESAEHSPKTVAWYRYQLERFFHWLVENKLQNSNWLQPEVIELYLAASRHKGNESATVAGHYRALSAFFAWLVQRQYIDRSPVERVAPPKITKKEPKRAVMAEYLALLDSIEAGTWFGLRDRLIIKTLFLCGVRRGECATLKEGDYRLPEHLLFVDGKTGPRLVPMLPAVEQAFVAYIYSRPPWPTPHLFLSADGGGKPRRLISGNGIYQMLQVTLPASAEGITFVDQVADGAWLCKRLAGVQVLVLSDYRGEEQGEWLGVVPHAVLLRTGIGAEEATVLVRKFWEGIGLEKEPAMALEEAIGCCAMEVRQLVEVVV